MKNLIALLIALAMPCLLSAQSEINETYPLNGAKALSVDFLYGDLKIEQYDGNEVQLAGMITVNGEGAAKEFEISSNKSGNTLSLNATADFDGYEQQQIIIMKDGKKIYKTGKKISIENLEEGESVDKVYNGIDVDADFTLRIPRNIDLKVETTYGSVRVSDYWSDMNLHSTYGSVDVVLENAPSTPVFNVSSTYSEVDVMIPESVNADLRLTTGYGKIYTDMDFQPDYKDKREGCHYGQDITAKLNNGKGAIKLDATYSNIYLRKSL